MNKLTKIIFVVILFLALPLKHWGQQPYRQYADDGIILNFFEIDNIDFRLYLLNQLGQDDRFTLTSTDEYGIFYVNPNSENATGNFFDTFDSFFNTSSADFELIPKVDLQDLVFRWKECVLPSHFISITMDIAINRATTDNDHCVDSDPFCTSEVISFNASTSTQQAESVPDKGCLGSTYNPSWFHMRINTPGQFIIHMEGVDPDNPSTQRDIDFCIWGPFTDPTTPCTSQLTTGKIIDCCYSASYSENIYLGYPASQHVHNTSHGTINEHTPQTGEYYILLITNFSRQPCTISFTKAANSGPGTTDCGILPPLVDNSGPYCVGETIHLSANGQSGATYSWSGPGGFTSPLQNPTRPNCTMNMAGTYTCTIAIGSQTNSATTDVVIYPQPNANFTYTSVCKGTPTQFTSTSTTNPTGQQIQSYQWNFGDGQTSTGQNVTHTYAQAGNYQVTHTVSTGNGHCIDQKIQSVPVYAAPIASASATPNTVIYGGTSTLTASAGTQGSFNFHWEPADMVVNANAQTTQTVPLQATQTYTVTVTNPQGGCTSTAQVTVSMEGSNMTAMASADQYELCEGESTTLHASPSGGTGNYTYSWTPANTLNNPSSQNPVATPPVGSTTYTCSVSDGITNQNVTVTIIVHPNTESHIYESICENDTYDFFEQNLQSPGVYEHIVQTQYGCDSTIHLHLDNWQTYETPISDHFCQGETYMFFNQTLYSSGTYYHTLESIHGCDSIVRLTLIQNPSYEVEQWESTCEGGPGYYFNGQYLQPSVDPYPFTFETQLGCDSIVILHIDEDEYNSKTYNVSLCATEYTWGSNHVTYYESGTYYDTLSFPNVCDSTIVLNLELRPSYDIVVEETSCDSYRWKNDTYNVDMTFTQSTEYTHYFVNEFGCNSEVTLYLTINNHNEESFTVVDEESCDSYYWDPKGHEIIYTDHPDLVYDQSGIYHRTYKNQYDCDSLVTMNVQFEYTPSPSEIYPIDAENAFPHWVVTATEFQINAYDFSLWDTNPNCHWDTVTWTCDEAPLWILEPFGDKGKCCKVFVLNRVEDTIWLKAHAFNRCTPENGIEQKYWLVCSFYGVEEQSEKLADFTIVPNPNNGQMTLNFEYITGKTHVKVYDMRGSLIDSFETYNANGPSHYTYNMKTKSDGIYFIIVTSKEGTIAKKVVIQH